MTTAFALLLRRHLDERADDNARSIALKIGMPPDYLYKVITGRKPPLLRHVIGLADALRLDGRVRYDFLIAAVHAHVPAEARTLLALAQAQHARRDLDAVALDRVTQANPPAPRRRGRRPVARPAR